MSDAFVIYNLKKELKTLKQNLTESLSQGVENFEEYKYILGKLHMLDICQQEISRLLDKQEKLDD
jgi:hypothetical protein|tara:strand:- start:139 stop:333 length:195 start_codon:yes stop_codon:yes gene_type:complete